MILVDLDDVRRIHSHNIYNPNGPTEFRLTPGERAPWIDDPDFFESEKRFYPGPYLLRVNEEGAWISRDGERWEQAVKRERHPCVETTMWFEYLTLYADAAGISTNMLQRRYSSIWRQLSRTRGRWLPWSSLYHWPEGSDLVWSGFLLLEIYETREIGGRKEVRYVSR